ncbi:trypsin-like peptidase domain-containing protein [Arthrobacter sp. I2-34]|uniref:Trypsin-like peptidase domain-containing protein n=1 Tax=Arthrobacter hankyongi TaxID=2904801 RepID=A0ABS9L690_9MICC|nr:trypsin-like peptidase domain-containing protein [Arthrobacter hankyongi]MCG2622195.1 trypsin-like peptidase domain-containing protein [Arthrobacter hankyongi]
MNTLPEAQPAPDRYAENPLDAYSRTVIRVAETVTPHVAAIEVTATRRNGQVRIGGGSAVVFTEDGYLLTNAHVVAGASAGRAAFADGTRMDIDIVGADPLSDLAVLRGRIPTPAPALLGDADQLKVGQLVIAVGNPLGLAGSVTAGVVSGLGRSIPTAVGRTRRVIEDVIQTDAALNPGSSGGALADAGGRIVGINTAVAGVGLGLAVPINATTRRIIAALLTDGRVRRAYLGLVSTPVPLSEPDVLRTGQRRALRVVEVMAGSPAETAGLHAGDLVLSAGGRPVASAESLQKLLFADAIGVPFPLAVLRSGTVLEVLTMPQELTDAA